ncbi:MAG: hypothetical protein F6K23_09590 [Okeania sp. SIO2C9]|uniref:hypothetical protein n=1 Tax=Okeania sp. SIO2C9 TaxID=2607791 RepID=UPI0013BFF167|nr:hypothetical protein [Okeania sp. SIO2C9]NEQ73299.1 hypothetical protein [Okeania sp. SIO2C9]
MKGLYLFFSQQLTPELNLIEAEWHQIKTHKIVDRMFENEYDLALGNKKSLCQRSSAKKYQLKQYSNHILFLPKILLLFGNREWAMGKSFGVYF